MLAKNGDHIYKKNRKTNQNRNKSKKFTIFFDKQNYNEETNPMTEIFDEI